MLRFGLFGAGRIGRMHARNLASIPGVELTHVYDIDSAAAAAAAQETGASSAASPAAIFEDPQLDAVFIASSTDTHCDLLAQAVAAGKSALCEKPIHLDIERVEQCRTEIGGSNDRVQIGFNRRFDPHHMAVRAAIEGGEVGKLEKLILTSRDPGPPPLEYLKVSGGLFRDMMIHDFDLARFLSGEEPVEVSAMGSAIVSDEIGSIGDVDTAMVIMRMESGALCHINCSRRAVYGYDQRVEAFGSNGMVIENNRTATTVERYSSDATSAREPLLNFFIERYEESYKTEVQAFVETLAKGATPTPSFEDGRRALILANAAIESLKSGKTVAVRY